MGFEASEKIIFATRNIHKISELQEMVGEYGLTVVSLDDENPEAPDVDETGSTFAENAALKALSGFSAAGGQVVMADDSGICVDALGGAPGIHSARYAGDDESNNDRILQELEGLSNRQAHYHCSLVMVCSRDWLVDGELPANVRLQAEDLPQGAVLVQFEGEVHGEITHSREGVGGFGYDPLFFVPQLGLTFAQVDGATKHRMSHRGVAFRALVDFLSVYLKNQGDTQTLCSSSSMT